MNYYSVRLSRSQLVDLFSDLSTARNTHQNLEQIPLSLPYGGECIAIWPEYDKDGWPSTFVVEDSALKDFLAWSTTYARSFTPFTAHFRVVSWSNFIRVEESQRRSEFSKRISKRLSLGALGLILGEAFGVAQRHRKLSDMPLLLFKSTVSYALNRALHLALSPRESISILDRALPLQYRNAASTTLGFQRAIRTIWTELLSDEYPLELTFSTTASVQNDAVRSLLQRGIISEEILFNLADKNPSLVNLLPQSKDILEARMENLTTFFSSKELMRISDANRAILMGYFLSRIAPGTLDHLPLLLDLRDHAPEIALWYCFSAGCAEDSRIEIDNLGLGRLLARDFKAQEDSFDPPKADISVNELDMLPSATTFDFPRASLNSLLVELYPRVYMVLKTSHASEQRHSNIGAQNDVLNSLRDLLDQAQGIIARANRENRSLISRRKRP